MSLTSRLLLSSSYTIRFYIVGSQNKNRLNTPIGKIKELSATLYGIL